MKVQINTKNKTQHNTPQLQLTANTDKKTYLETLFGSYQKRNEEETELEAHKKQCRQSVMNILLLLVGGAKVKVTNARFTMT